MSLVSRGAFVGASSAIALAGTSLMHAFVAAAQSADPSDLAALNIAIELERAGIAAYEGAIGSGLLTPPVVAIAQGFAGDHRAHRDALIAAVRAGGGAPSPATAAITAPPLHSQRDVLAFAITIERKAAATYLSVVPELRDRKLAQTAAAILGIETTHVAILAEALGERAYPGAFVS